MSISIELARSILEACKHRARDLRSPASIAIVDAGGHLVLFERMMAPYGWATGDISIAKAYTSVMFNQSTDSVAHWAAAIPGFAASLATMTGGKFIMAAGGWPIRVNGITIGGLGVSGGNAIGRDDDIARAGLAVLGAMAPAAQSVQPPPAQYPPPWAQPSMPASYQGTVPQSVPAYQNVEQPVPNAYRAEDFLDAPEAIQESPQVQQTTDTINLSENDPYDAFSKRISNPSHPGYSGEKS